MTWLFGTHSEAGVEAGAMMEKATRENKGAEARRRSEEGGKRCEGRRERDGMCGYTSL